MSNEHGHCCHSEEKGEAKRSKHYYTCPMCPSVQEEKPGACPMCGMALDPPTRSAEVFFTCPMHPEVRESSPGSCPKCGMALEPSRPVEEEDAELKYMRRRFWISLALTLPLFILAMSGMFVETGEAKPWYFSAWLEFLLATPVVLWAGWPFTLRAWQSIRHRSPNMFTLIAIGTWTAWIYSTVAAFFPSIFPDFLVKEGKDLALYFESAAVIITLVLLGQVIEVRARGKTKDSLRQLLELTPPTAIRISSSGEEKEIALSEVRVGDKLRVRADSRIPLDGKVVEGESLIDESTITGESVPSEKGPGDEVIGGTLNQSGSLIIEATSVGEDTLLAKIVSQVAEAQRTQAPIQRVADRVASYFVPAVVLVAVLSFALWLIFGPSPALPFAIIAAVSVLIIACPCALGLATPMSITVASGRAAQMGVLFRDAKAIETLSDVDVVIFDKTGTLTKGVPQIKNVFTNEIEENRALSIAAALEARSHHPIAKAILRKAKDEGVRAIELDSFDSEVGLGLRGSKDDETYLIGSRKFMGASKIDVSNIQESASFFLAVNDRVAAGFELEDEIKETSKEALALLRQDGIEAIIASGDDTRIVEDVAKEVGIEVFYGQASPTDKANLVKELQAQGKKVAMAGDGTNDAPALAAAQVGIAMGSGTDIAMETASVTIVQGDLLHIAKAVDLAKKTKKNIWQNLFFAFAYNAIGIPIAAGVFYPWTKTMLSPMIAAAAMSFSSVSVITNSLRLRRK